MRNILLNALTVITLASCTRGTEFESYVSKLTKIDVGTRISDYDRLASARGYHDDKLDSKYFGDNCIAIGRIDVDDTALYVLCLHEGVYKDISIKALSRQGHLLGQVCLDRSWNSPFRDSVISYYVWLTPSQIIRRDSVYAEGHYIEDDGSPMLDMNGQPLVDIHRYPRMDTMELRSIKKNPECVYPVIK